MENNEINLISDDVIGTLNQPKTSVTQFFDKVDRIDRKLYGMRMKLFIWGCVLVLIGAPILDELLGIEQGSITYMSTLLFFLFDVVIALAFVSAWRDDSGNWSWERAKSRLQTYYEISKDHIQSTRTNSQDENLYKLGQYLIFGGLGWKAIQNVSVFVRVPLENLFSTSFYSLRKFERFTNHYYWAVLFIGFGILVYLYNKNPKIVERIKSELSQLFGISNSESKYSTDIVKMTQNTSTDLVINPKRNEHISSTMSLSTSVLFSDFVVAMQNWNPRQANYEYEYQDRLYRHLRKHMPDANIEMEYPIGENYVGSRGRADIVVNDTILIEMKRDSSAGAIQRAKGQIAQYSEIWKEKGPVILLLCDYDYEKARLAFLPTMQDLAKLNRPALTIVSRAKGDNLPLSS